VGLIPCSDAYGVRHIVNHYNEEKKKKEEETKGSVSASANTAPMNIGSIN